MPDPKSSLRDKPAPGDVGIVLNHNKSMVYTDPANAGEFMKEGLASPMKEYDIDASKPIPTYTRTDNLGNGGVGQTPMRPVPAQISPGNQIAFQQPTERQLQQGQPRAELQEPPVIQSMSFPPREVTPAQGLVTVMHPVTGNQVQTTPEMAQQLIQDGHAVAVPNG